MDIIDRLKDPELYIDAIDDAVTEIERLRILVGACDSVYKTQWAHDVLEILNNRNRKLATRFADFMRMARRH